MSKNFVIQLIGLIDAKLRGLSRALCQLCSGELSEPRDVMFSCEDLAYPKSGELK